LCVPAVEQRVPVGLEEDHRCAERTLAGLLRSDELASAIVLQGSGRLLEVADCVRFDLVKT
jgi:hypothetical protein